MLSPPKKKLCQEKPLITHSGHLTQDFLQAHFKSSWSAVSIVRDGGKIVLIDSGPSSAMEHTILPWLKDNGLGPSDVYMIINTHAHGDHIGSNFNLKQVNNNISIAAHHLASEKIRNPYKAAMEIRNEFSKYIPAPPPDGISGVAVDVPLHDNDIIDVGRTTLKILHTPGHDTDCICIYEPRTKTLFSGDSFPGGGTQTSGVAFYQDVNSYRKSLRRIKTLDVETLVLGHPFFPSDGVVKGRNKVDEYLELCLRYSRLYDEKILRILSEGAGTVLDITPRLVDAAGGCPGASWSFLSLHTVNAHLLNLSENGKVSRYVENEREFWEIP